MIHTLEGPLGYSSLFTRVTPAQNCGYKANFSRIAKRRLSTNLHQDEYFFVCGCPGAPNLHYHFDEIDVPERTSRTTSNQLSTVPTSTRIVCVHLLGSCRGSKKCPHVKMPPSIYSLVCLVDPPSCHDLEP